MSDSAKNIFHTALPYLSYFVNMLNRVLSVISSFLGYQIPNIPVPTEPKPEDSSEETT